MASKFALHAKLYRLEPQVAQPAAPTATANTPAALQPHPARAAHGRPGAWAGLCPAAPPCRFQGSAHTLRAVDSVGKGESFKRAEMDGTVAIAHLRAWQASDGSKHSSISGCSLSATTCRCISTSTSTSCQLPSVCSPVPAAPVWWFRKSATFFFVCAGSSACAAIGAITPPEAPGPSAPPSSMSATAGRAGGWQQHKCAGAGGSALWLGLHQPREL